MDREYIQALFEKWCHKLRITPGWDVKLEFGENRALSYGRCRQMQSFNDLYDGLNNM